MSARDELERLRNSIPSITKEESDQLRDIERTIKKLEGYETFGRMPAVIDLVAWAKAMIQSGNERLSTDRDLAKDGHEGERLAIMERSDVLLYIIGLLDPSAELEAIEKELAGRRASFERYNGDIE